MHKERILIIEDDEALREVIKLALENNGFTNIVTAEDGEIGLKKARELLPALILLDLMLPGIDGLNVCKQLKNSKETEHIPIIMLTARSEEADIVVGLEMGACDYITKPFSNKVLVARIRAQLRSRTDDNNSSEEIHYNNLVIDPSKRTVLINKKIINLTFTEFEILLILSKQPGRVYSRDQIISKIKGQDYPVTERAIDVQIVSLRKKLGSWAKYIETVRGIGYRVKNNL